MALVEIALVFLGLMAVDLMYPALEMADLRPHPYWIPVLLLSLQYGTVSGLTAAAVAVGLRSYAGFPEQGGSETYFGYLLKIWIEPIMWIAAAVFLGQFRMRQISRHQDLIYQVSELANQRAALADYSRNLRTHCTALERQIASRSEPGAIQILHTIEQIRSDGTGHLGTRLDDALTKLLHLALPGAKATVYCADSTGLRMAASAGHDGGEPPQPVFAAAAPVFKTIVGEGRGVSVLSKEGEACLAGSGLAAAPVFATALSAPNGKRAVAGMIKIETIMDPAQLGPSLVPALITLGQAFAPALESRLVAAGQHPLVPADTPVTSSAYKILRRLNWFTPAASPVEGPPAPPTRNPSKAMN